MDSTDSAGAPTRRMDDPLPDDAPTRRMDPGDLPAGVPTQRLDAAVMPSDSAEPVLGELTLTGYDDGPLQQHQVTLRLTARSLTPALDAAATQAIQNAFNAGEDRLAYAPGFIQEFVTHLLDWVQQGIASVLAPHPLRDTDVHLDGDTLHLRLGHFRTIFPDRSFDPAAARDFIARYAAAKAGVP